MTHKHWCHRRKPTKIWILWSITTHEAYISLLLVYIIHYLIKCMSVINNCSSLPNSLDNFVQWQTVQYPNRYHCCPIPPSILYRFYLHIQSNIRTRSLLLSSPVTFFLSCHQQFHMNWSSFNMPHVTKEHLNTSLTVNCWTYSRPEYKLRYLSLNDM